MKLSTVLASLFLTALQADASPVDSDSEHSLKLTRRAGYCCVGGGEGDSAEGRYIERGTGDLILPTITGCTWLIQRNPDNCNNWHFTLTKSCQESDNGLTVSIKDDKFCKNLGCQELPPNMALNVERSTRPSSVSTTERCEFHLIRPNGYDCQGRKFVPSPPDCPEAPIIRDLAVQPTEHCASPMKVNPSA
ncbi:hypothetical protein E4U43_007272 [Claviceps pusilla]|uniref:Secreted protein n=1 Tax=Claviceps pusilla TaxID=123648 RepID=A0A9P7T1T1_9HYPO|nr:hypothetical protein E4U43_007272 [Claviceps pusilla]